MKFGFYLPNIGPTAQPESLAAIGRRGDELGFDCMVIGDHLVVPETIDSPYPYTIGGEFVGGDEGEFLEQLTVLSYLAAITTNIRLATSVMIMPYRPPLIAAKMLSTLDVLSRGRLILGIGVGWLKEEFDALGAPPFSERGAVTDEYVQAFTELWTSDDPHFDGKYCRFSNIKFLPKPLQKPRPPIWVGGQSRRAIRRAAQLCDGWHPVAAIPASPLEPDELSENLALLRRYAEEVGRDPNTLDVAVKVPTYGSGSEASAFHPRFSGSSERIRQDVQIYADLGVTHLIFDIRGSELAEALERLERFATEIMPGF